MIVVNSDNIYFTNKRVRGCDNSMVLFPRYKGIIFRDNLGDVKFYILLCRPNNGSSNSQNNTLNINNGLEVKSTGVRGY